MLFSFPEATQFAFYAYIAATTIYPDETTVVFDSVLSNLGGAYNPDNGNFVGT